MKKEGHDFPTVPRHPWTSIFNTPLPTLKGCTSPLTEVRPQKASCKLKPVALLGQKDY